MEIDIDIEILYYRYAGFMIIWIKLIFSDGIKISNWKKNIYHISHCGFTTGKSEFYTEYREREIYNGEACLVSNTDLITDF